MNHSQELKFRTFIRGALKQYVKSINDRAVEELKEEIRLRNNIRELIVESSLNSHVISEAEEPDADVHDNTGINTLKDLLKNTNILSTLRSTYKTLTTSEDQRSSFRAHIIKWVEDTLAPITINDAAPEPPPVNEALEVDVTPEDEDKFIDASDGSPAIEAEDPETEDDNMQAIKGQDTTGRNKAERVYPKIETSIVDYYGELDNDEDMELFHDYLIANLKLYFDKWENEMTPDVDEPTNDAYSAEGATEAEGEIPDEMGGDMGEVDDLGEELPPI